MRAGVIFIGGEPDVKAVIVAAGRGTRLHPLTRDTPKCLLHVGGKPILQHQLNRLAAAGLDDVVVVTGHHAGMIRELYGKGLDYVHNPDYRLTNNLYSLWCARSHVRGDPFLYLHSDLLFDAVILERCLAAPGNIVLAVEKEPCSDEAMRVAVEGGRVTDVSKSLSSASAHGEFIGLAKLPAWGGALLMEEAANTLAEDGKDTYFASAITRLARRCIRVDICHTDGRPWIEVDTEEDLRRAEDVAEAILRP